MLCAPAKRYVMNRPRKKAPLPDPPGKIVHLDRHVVVVAKMAGVATVPFRRGERGTLSQWVQKKLLRIDPKGPRLGARPAVFVVQRLDFGTSGVLVFARTVSARESLRRQLKDRTVERTYLALVHGQGPERKTFRTHIVENRGDQRRGSREKAFASWARQGQKEKLAVTHVRLMEKLRGASLVLCKLETGRRHQIRIHLGESGHPLLGETMYSKGFKGRWIDAPRLLLHAATLGFAHPKGGGLVRFEEPLPLDMAEMLDRLRPAKAPSA